MTTNSIFPYLEQMLDVAAKRQQALSSNLANLDTPGYKAIDVSFAQELSSSIQLNTTKSSSPQLNLPGLTSGGIEMVEMDGPVKPNGNTVDIERQMTEITKNGLQYVTLIQYMSQKLKTLRTAITEGGK